MILIYILPTYLSKQHLGLSSRVMTGDLLGLTDFFNSTSRFPNPTGHFRSFVAGWDTDQVLVLFCVCLMRPLPDGSAMSHLLS